MIRDAYLSSHNGGSNLNCSLGGMGSLGAFLSTTVAMGCCPGVLAPLASVAVIALPLLDDPPFQMPVLYGTVGLTLIGLVIAYRRHRSLWYLIVGLAGAFLLLVPFHTALEMDHFYLLIGLGLGGLLLGSWGPLIGKFLYGLLR